METRQDLGRYRCRECGHFHKVVIFREGRKYRVEPGRLVVHPGALVRFVSTEGKPEVAFTSVVATQLGRLLKAGVDLARFRSILVGGGPLGPDLRERAERAGARVIETYGLTESCSGDTLMEPGMELAKIGSRPARRGVTRDLSDLRAIPWGFSWGQCRVGLPGWFGFGSAIEQYLGEAPKTRAPRLARIARPVESDGDAGPAGSGGGGRHALFLSRAGSGATGLGVSRRRTCLCLDGRRVDERRRILGGA